MMKMMRAQDRMETAGVQNLYYKTTYTEYNYNRTISNDLSEKKKSPVKSFTVDQIKRIIIDNSIK